MSLPRIRLPLGPGLTDDTGRFTVEADLEELRDDEVVLKRVDGTRITVRLERLSTSARRYLASLATPGRDGTGTSRQRRAGEHLAGQAKVPTRLGREAIIQAMALPTNYTLDETPLSLALQELASQRGVPVYLDVAELRASGITVDTPMTASGS